MKRNEQPLTAVPCTPCRGCQFTGSRPSAAERGLLGKPQHAAYRKGRGARERGEARVAPYSDIRTSYHDGVTFSASWIRAWLSGYDDPAPLIETAIS